MRFRASQVADATTGRLLGADVDLDGASFDTRTLQPGQLFVPIVAERDGHDFLAMAAAAGAPAAVSSRPADASLGLSIVEVVDTGRALLDLAAWARARLAASVVGITGSVGKTTTKDLCAAAIGAGRRVAANLRSLNNDQGLPVTVLDAPDDTEVLVVEMGMRGIGEIARLCAVARPNLGIVTAVAPAHTERVGGIDGVARAKAELVEALPAGGTAILNADDERVAAMAERTPAAVLLVGRHADADVRIEDLALDERALVSFTVRTPWGTTEVRLGLPGAHLATNAALALAAAGVVGVDLDDAAAALADAPVSPRRMQVLAAAGGGVVVNDAYNANPASVLAALDALSAMRAERRLAVLGLMAELDDPPAAHRAVAAAAAAHGIEVVAVDTALFGLESVARDDLVATLGPVPAGTVVLVKGSLVAGLGPVADALAVAR